MPLMAAPASSSASASASLHLLSLLLPLLLVVCSVVVAAQDVPAAFNRSSFGPNFVFGTASSAYQHEGAYNVHNKPPSIWDTYSHDHPERIKDGSNGDVAVDQYHRYREDVSIMEDTGFDAYRFSISWSRVMNYESGKGKAIPMGIEHYNKLINELLSKGVQPYVTLYHFDVPQQLEDRYGGLLSKRIVSDFQDYAEVCFEAFGDRVKHWITVNEPSTVAINAYHRGTHAPGRCSKFIANCTGGNSATEPYIVSHNMILAHAAAVKVYRERYQAQQRGVIGITLSTYWFEPYSEHENDHKASQRAQDFTFGCYMDPISFGDYPTSMKQLVRNRLPKFTTEESNMVKGSYDFLGLNYYTAIYAKNLHYTTNILASYETDHHANLTAYRNGIPIGPPEYPYWMYVYPKGFEKLLIYVKERYDNPPMYITENGIAQNYEITTLLADILNDTVRVNYHDQHLQYLLKAINEQKMDVRGYFAWSLLDNYEWDDGYTAGFGINYVNLTTLERYPKQSSLWFKKFLLR